jgi:hypothetical protein
MGSFSDYWESKVLDYTFGKGGLTPPPIFVGLSSTDPTDDGSAVAEPNGNNYERVQASASDWSVASGGTLSNISEIVFALATGNWGTMTHFALFDALTGGNMLVYGPLGESKAIDSGDIAKFAAGDLEVKLN